jgi:hypothetical protein
VLQKKRDLVKVLEELARRRKDLDEDRKQLSADEARFRQQWGTADAESRTVLKALHGK